MMSEKGSKCNDLACVSLNQKFVSSDAYTQNKNVTINKVPLYLHSHFASWIYSWTIKSVEFVDVCSAKPKIVLIQECQRFGSFMPAQSVNKWTAESVYLV